MTKKKDEYNVDLKTIITFVAALGVGGAGSHYIGAPGMGKLDERLDRIEQRLVAIETTLKVEDKNKKTKGPSLDSILQGVVSILHDKDK